MDNLTNVNSLTNNNVSDRSSQISGKNIAWVGNDGNDDEIFLYDHENGSVIQLTNNDTYDSNPQIEGNNVVWSSSDGNDREIYLYNGSQIIQLTDNDVDDDNPQISDGNVAWLSYEGEPNYRYYPDNAIYFYDGTNTTRLTDAETVKSSFSLSGNNLAWSDYDGKDSEIYFYDGTGVTQLTTNSLSESRPQISGSNIVWSAYEDGDSEIYLYDGSEIVQLTDNDTYDSSPQVSGNNVVWSGDDGNDSEVFLYNGSETIQLTNNDRSDHSLQISGDNVIWSSYDGNDNEIFLYNGSETIQITDNDTYDSNPQIDGDYITWTGYGDGDSEIYLNYSPNLAPGTIEGYKWHDLNENGLFDSNESGIEGWTIYLDSNENGQLDDGERSTVTDANGFYAFTDLQFGNYSVTEENEPRWSQTYPSTIEYQWQDSKQPDGITYDWIDISGVGTELNLGDDEAVEVTLPFDFDFYGETNNTVTISSNGYLTFGDNGTEYRNEGITNSYNVSNFIAPFWDDLNPGYSGSIYHHYDAEADRFIVQYQDVARYEVEGALTFQTLLNSDGSIVYQYNNLDAAVNSATVGLENPDGDAGLQIVHNNNNDDNPYLEDGLAIEFTPVNSSDTVNTHEVFVGTGETISDLNFGNKLEALRVETEDYQDYYDTTAGNTGVEYRDDDVDLGVSGDVNGGYTVGWISSGEWLTYNVDVPEDGIYQVVARIASDFGTSHNFDVSVDGQSTTVNFGSTGGWQAWSDALGGNLQLTAGTHELRLDMGSTGFNLNYIDLVTPENIRIEAEDYQDDYYTSDQTFYDTDYENIGGGYRNRPVDIEPTSDISGGFNVGWIEGGEWLTYSVDIPYDGNYQVVARVASDVDISHSLDVAIDGQLTTLSFGDTGGWQSWTDAIGDDLYLTAGTHELRLDMGSSGFNVNYIDLISEYNLDSDELLMTDSGDF
ncbi:MAG: carbohydrate-binding protein [Pleurocapsa sp. MO_226.B13]|nr:carbohydrate-binding protein [Pleurocapsa sp. MO_226.B13]